MHNLLTRAKHNLLPAIILSVALMSAVLLASHITTRNGSADGQRIIGQICGSFCNRLAINDVEETQQFSQRSRSVVSSETDAHP